MPFNSQIPQPTDLQSDSQGALLANNGFLQTWSNTNHYGLTDSTVNNGKHSIIEMPVQATQPVTVDDPMFYSFQQPTGNAGILQYMCQAGGAVQSPITPIQSSATGISLAPTVTSNVMDFTGLPYSYGYLIGCGISSGPTTPWLAGGWFFWSGSQGITVLGNSAPTPIGFLFSGGILQIKNVGTVNLSSISWTIGFNRIFTPL